MSVQGQDVGGGRGWVVGSVVQPGARAQVGALDQCGRLGEVGRRGVQRAERRDDMEPGSAGVGPHLLGQPTVQQEAQ